MESTTTYILQFFRETFCRSNSHTTCRLGFNSGSAHVIAASIAYIRHAGSCDANLDASYRSALNTSKGCPAKPADALPWKNTTPSSNNAPMRASRTPYPLQSLTKSARHAACASNSARRFDDPLPTHRRTNASSTSSPERSSGIRRARRTSAPISCLILKDSAAPCFGVPVGESKTSKGPILRRRFAGRGGGLDELGVATLELALVHSSSLADGLTSAGSIPSRGWENSELEADMPGGSCG